MGDMEPPPDDDNTWLLDVEPTYAERDRFHNNGAPPTGYWVRKPDRTPTHQCELPDGPWIVGALWRCTEGHLWQIRDVPDTDNGHVYTFRGLEWVPAGWRTRRKYGPGMKRATFDMATERARKWKPKPPKASASAAPDKPPTDCAGDTE